MGEIHICIEADHSPKTVTELVEYLRTDACVDFETGRRVLPRFIDDEVFDRAALLIEAAYITGEAVPFTSAAAIKARREDGLRRAPFIAPAHPITPDEVKLRRSKALDELGALDGELL